MKLPNRQQLKPAVQMILGRRIARLIHRLLRAWDIKNGRWTEPEISIIATFVQPGDSVVDVGANYGLYTYHLSHAVGDAGRVRAYEPVPDTFDALTLTSRLLRLRNVALFPKGVGDVQGKIIIDVPLTKTGDLDTRLAHRSGRGTGKVVGTDPSPQENVQYECDTVTLDDETSGENISFIKLDIEGTELWALFGAKNLLRTSNPVVLCEINPDFLLGFQLRTEDIVSYMASLDYQVYVYNCSAHKLKAVTAKEIREGNYIFLHQDSVDRFADLLS